MPSKMRAVTKTKKVSDKALAKAHRLNVSMVTKKSAVAGKAATLGYLLSSRK